MTRPQPLPAAATAFVLLCWSSPAHAQPSPEKPAPGPSANDVVAPKLEYDPGVRYPEAALKAGEFAVVSVGLVLELGADGSVQRASVETPGRAPFDEAALEAARKLRFSPATRNGVAVPAKIRFRYRFEPAPPVLSGRVLDRNGNAPIAGVRVIARGANGQELQLELDEAGAFRSERLPPGVTHLVIEAPGYESQTSDVSLNPQGETGVDVRLERIAEPLSNDAKGSPSAPPVEVIVQGERLAPAVSSLTRAEVRQLPGAFGDPFRAIESLPGVTPIASGLPFFYVRGAPPGNVGYFVDGIRVPFLYHVAIGPSVIHPGLVERVDLYPGGYPARFGRYAGGIVSAESTAPRYELHGEANVRPFDAGAMVETGFADGRGSVLLGGRYSFTAALFSLLVPDLKLDYRDYQARVTYDVTSRDRLSLLGIGSYDLLAQEQSKGLNVLFGAEFYRVDLRHDHRFDTGSLTSSVTLGFDQSHVGDEGNAIDRSLAARTEYRTTLGANTLWRAGADVLLDDYSTARPKYYDPDNPETQLFEANNPTRTDLTSGVWSDFVLTPAPGIEVTPGVRFDLYRSRGTSKFAIDPRIAARFKVASWLTIVHADGISHQAPAFVIPLPGRTAAGLEGGLQESFQTSAGIEAELGAGTKLTATAFYNSFFNMTDALASNRDGPPDANTDERSLGSAVGLELYLHRDLTRRLGGFLSYTLSRSLRSIGRERFPNSFDRTHVLNAALAYDLGRKWRAGTRFVFYTGTPEVPDSNGLIAPLRSEHPGRTAPFYRVDLRLEKRWNLGKTGDRWISFVAELMNATLSKESFGDQEVGPITIPSIGAEAGF
jgi:TonB family protein